MCTGRSRPVLVGVVKIDMVSKTQRYTEAVMSSGATIES